MPLHRIEHVLVLSEDADATRDFWRDVFGLEEGERPPLEFSGHWLYAEGVPVLHIADRAEYAAHAATMGLSVPEGSGTPVDHVAFAASDYEALVARLEERGVPYVPNVVRGPGIRQLFVHDPNGVRVELNVPPGR